MSQQQRPSEQRQPLSGLSPVTQVAQCLVAVIAARDGKLAMVLGGHDRWRAAGGYTFLPLELPGMTLPAGARPASQSTALARRALGCEAWVVSSAGTYGPSERHRIDRLDIGEQPAPLIRVDRFEPLEESADGGGPHLGRVLAQTYLAEFQGDPHAAQGTAGLLFLPCGALRQAVRGMPLRDLVALKGVEVILPNDPEDAAPENALAYISGEYGERHLLRAIAKYGPEILEG